MLWSYRPFGQILQKHNSRNGKKIRINNSQSAIIQKSKPSLTFHAIFKVSNFHCNVEGNSKV